MAWQCNVIIVQVDCCAVQSKTQSTFPPASTTNQSNFPTGLTAQALTFSNLLQWEKKWAFGKKLKF